MGGCTVGGSNPLWCECRAAPALPRPATPDEPPTHHHAAITAAVPSTPTRMRPPCANASRRHHMTRPPARWLQTRTTTATRRSPTFPPSAAGPRPPSSSTRATTPSAASASTTTGACAHAQTPRSRTHLPACLPARLPPAVGPPPHSHSRRPCFALPPLLCRIHPSVLPMLPSCLSIRHAALLQVSRLLHGLAQRDHQVPQRVSPPTRRPTDPLHQQLLLQPPRSGSALRWVDVSRQQGCGARVGGAAAMVVRTRPADGMSRLRRALLLLASPRHGAGGRGLCALNAHACSGPSLHHFRASSGPCFDEF